MLIFTFYPLFNTLLIAFLKDYNSATETIFQSIFKDGGGLTLDNFGYVLGITPKVIGDKVYYYENFVKYALPNTLIITFITVPLSVIISLLISVGLNSIKFLISGNVCRLILLMVFTNCWLTFVTPLVKCCCFWVIFVSMKTFLDDLRERLSREVFICV